MENWAYELRTLRGMAKHWKSGEPIDEATVHKLRSAKNYRAASMMLRQLKATSRVFVCVVSRHKPGTRDSTHHSLLWATWRCTTPTSTPRKTTPSAASRRNECLLGVRGVASPPLRTAPLW